MQQELYYKEVMKLGQKEVRSKTAKNENPYLPALESFGLETLGDVQRFLDDNAEDAYQLALSQLAVTDLDILASSAALQYLCLVYVLKNDGGHRGLKAVYDIINGVGDANSMLADMMLEQAKTLPFMQRKEAE